MSDVAFIREIATDTIRYWERKRLTYNAVLAAIVVVMAFSRHLPRVPESQAAYWFLFLQVLFVLAVIANVLYSAAYVVDVFAQMSDYRDAWKRWRAALFWIGLLVASIFTWSTAPILFASPGAVW